jgi:hypothetical protein
VLEIIEQSLGVLGDLEHPLPHEPALDRIAGLHVGAVLDLLVRQHGAESRAPVHGHVRHVGEPPFVQLEEDPLGPPIVVGIGRADLSVPVVGKSQALDLSTEGRDVALGDLGGMQALANRSPLGRQPERVPAHWMEHVETLHSLHSSDDVGGGVPLGMAHVEARTRRVGEHVEDVEFGLCAQDVRRGWCPERVAFLPHTLPLGLDDRWIVAVVGHSRLQFPPFI